ERKEEEQALHKQAQELGTREKARVIAPFEKSGLARFVMSGSRTARKKRHGRQNAQQGQAYRGQNRREVAIAVKKCRERGSKKKSDPERDADFPESARPVLRFGHIRHIRLGEREVSRGQPIDH